VWRRAALDAMRHYNCTEVSLRACLFRASRSSSFHLNTVAGRPKLISGKFASGARLPEMGETQISFT
jgi:hypothetical protein